MCVQLKGHGAGPGCGTIHHRKVMHQCTGIVIGWNETKKSARILTSFPAIHGLDPQTKLQVCLPNKTVFEGQVLFFNVHYNIALLEISSIADLPPELPSFGSNPNYGQEVFVLARGEESNLMARHGVILWFDESDHLGRNYHMFLSCKIPAAANGGPVVDHNGNVAGMAFFGGSLQPTILAISTILTCIEMWMKFRYQLTLLLEDFGVRYGDVIVSIDGLHVHTLPQLEDYLLSLGWGFLQGSIDSSSMVELKLEVYGLLERNTRSIILPVEFCDASET